MKLTFFLISITLLFIGLMLFSSFGGDANTDYPSGSPAGYTGSLYDGQDCYNCHGGSTAVVDDWITSDIPPDGYTPGTSYTITVTVTGTGTKGFEVSPHDVDGNLLGTLTAGPGNKLVGSNKYVTQSSGSSSNPKVWTFTWTAPSAGTGEVTFWGAFAVGKPTTKTSSMTVQENPALPLTVDATADPSHIMSGDSSHLGVLVSGGSGSYTYFWTSDPPGFSSTLQDPWAAPEENTTYFVEVSDGSVTETDSVEVTVAGVGIREPAADAGILLFPNPVVQYMTIVADGWNLEGMEAAVYSTSGKLLVLLPVRDYPPRTPYRMDLGMLPPGPYLFQLRNAQNQITRKIVKID